MVVIQSRASNLKADRLRLRDASADQAQLAGSPLAEAREHEPKLVPPGSGSLVTLPLMMTVEPLALPLFLNTHHSAILRMD